MQWVGSVCIPACNGAGGCLPPGPEGVCLWVWRGVHPLDTSPWADTPWTHPLGRHTHPCTHNPLWADTSSRDDHWAVRILLECILVFYYFALSLMALNLLGKCGHFLVGNRDPSRDNTFKYRKNLFLVTHVNTSTYDTIGVYPFSDNNIGQPPGTLPLLNAAHEQVTCPVTPRKGSFILFEGDFFL